MGSCRWNAHAAWRVSVVAAAVICLGLVVGGGAGTARAAGPAGEAAARGQAVFERRGCFGCHSLDGSRRAGPTFRGLFGKPRTVTTNGVERTVTADAAYLARSIREPLADIVVGHHAGLMPAFQLGDDELADVTAALQRLAEPTSGTVAASGGSPPDLRMLALAAAAFLFAFGHLILSSGPVRGPAVSLLGEVPFQLAYSVVILAAFVWMLYAYRGAPEVLLWDAPRWTRLLPLVAMPFSLYLLVAGFSTKNPAAAGQAAAARSPDAVRGILRITRHPALSGYTLWGLAHLPPNGDLASVLLFASVVALSVLGMLHIDRRRAAALGADWAAFAQKTSRLPFLAIVTGRNQLKLGELGVVRPLVALFVYAALLHFHKALIGASPLP